MDFYGDDRKLSELGEHSFSDFLDPDVFHPPSPLSGDYGVNPMDQDWLDTFLDPVLNDRMITEALQPPRIQSEHSYSLANSDDSPDSPMIKLEPTEKEDCDLIPTAITSPLNLTMRTNERQSVEVPCSEAAAAVSNLLKTEDTDFISSMDTTPSLTTMTKQPTIILATSSSAFTRTTEQVLLPKVEIKLEPEILSPDCSPYHESIGLPPTPPSSNTSDNESCSLSPSRSSPSSPVRQSQVVHHANSLGMRTLSHTPLFTSPVSILDSSSQYLIPTSGMLLLSEEEKRTLISEGYPIPNKLPLTKQEEKNLKKIRRKIKNKISAQDSRRKKKEYLESLEKRVESFSQENVDLRKKVESLENNNRSLLSQLQKLQSLVKQLPRPSPTTQTSSCLMVLVLCFAMFLGNCNLSPTTLIGYKTTSVASDPAPSNKIPLGPAVKDANIDSYATPNLRSRVLLSLREEIDYDAYGPATPFGYKDLFMQWFQDCSADLKEASVVYEPHPDEMEPELPHARIDHEELDELSADTNIAELQLATTLIDLDGDWSAVQPPLPASTNVTAKVVAISHAHLNTTAA